MSYFALIHPICFFYIEKEECLFHMGLKTKWTEFECFNWNIILRHYINEFIRIIDWINLNVEKAYRNYAILTRKEIFFSHSSDYLDSTEY